MAEFIGIRDEYGNDWWRDELGRIGGYRICDCLKLNAHTNPHCSECAGEGYIETREQDLTDKELTRIRRLIQLEEQRLSYDDLEEPDRKKLRNRYGTIVPNSIRDYWL